MRESRAVVELNLEDILPNRFQPRIKFDEKAITDLSESIKEHGVIQPIIVRRIGDKYEIIAGERRYKASVMAGKSTIPAIIVDLNDKDSSEVALIENVQRQDLTPIEEAISYRKILDMGYLTQEDLATKLGVAQSTIANKLRLLNLSEEVQDALLEERISERHARSLLKLNKESMQKEMLKKIINERLTVRKTDEEIDKMMKEKDKTSVFDSIENNMVNGMNSFSPNNDTNSNPFIINNNENLNPTYDNQNINIPKQSNDIEIIDFGDSNESYNIPTMPIVEDISEPIQDEQSNFNFSNPVPVQESTVKVEENNNLNSFSNQNNEENSDSDSSDENILRPGRFFNILNYDNEETNENSETSISNDPLISPNNEQNGVSNIDNNENSMNVFNQAFGNSLNSINETNISNDSTTINTEQNVQNSQIDNFNFNSEPVKPVYEEEVVETKLNDNTNETTEVTNLRDIIQMVRNCADNIEKNNFEIDCEEFDFEDIYQVIFKIKKK